MKKRTTKRAAPKKRRPANLEALFKQARSHGNVTLMTIQISPTKMGWQCTIRPQQTASKAGDRWAINSWAAYGTTVSEAVSDAIKEAEGADAAPYKRDTGKPKLGGPEFDREPARPRT